MDILYFICLLIVIGAFFFIDKFTPTHNAMFIVVILSLIGIVSFWYVDIEIVEYGQYVLLNGTTDVYVFNTIDLTNSKIGLVNFQSFFILAYLMTLLVSATNIFLGKETRGKHHE